MPSTKKLKYWNLQPINFLLKLQIFSMPLVFIVWYLVPSYFPVVLASRMSFYGSDGNCVTNGIAFGSHCFGDYGALINGIRDVDNVWSSGAGTPYPPFGILMMKIFVIMNTHLGPTASLIIYLLSLFFAYIFPIWHSTKNFNLIERLQLFCLSTLIALPFLNTIDRGNNLVWAIPFLYLGISNLNHKKSILYLAISIALRPQLCIFLILLLFSRKHKQFFQATLLATTFYLFSFVLKLGRDAPNGILDFLKALRGQAAGIPGNWPPNLSMARGLKTIFELINFQILDTTIIRISLLIIITLLIKILLKSNQFKTSVLAINLVPLIFLIPPMTWYYYGSFLIIIVAIMIRDNLAIDEISFGNKTAGTLLLTSIWLTFTPLYIPIGSDFTNLVQIIVPIMWTLYYIYIISIPWKTFRQKIQPETKI